MLKGSIGEMTTRRIRVIDKPDRARGWCNGRYTKARNASNASYVAHCPECAQDTQHAWDDCTVCADRAKAKAAEKPRSKRRRGKKKRKSQ